MSNENPTPANHAPANGAGPHEARTKDKITIVDDIGLPSGIQPEDAGKLEEIKPDPAKTPDAS